MIRIGRLPKVLLSGTQKILAAPSIRTLTAMRCTRLSKGTMPVGGPIGWNVANAVTRTGRALLMTELAKFVIKAYRDISTRIVIFRAREKFSGSAGSGDGSGCR